MLYEKIKYPDGQLSVKVHGTQSSYSIKERINSYEDLFYINSIVNAIRNIMAKAEIRLTIPCLFGQRSDRRFSENQSFDLKLICDFINNMKLDSVTILDPHSDVSLALIDRSYKDSSYRYVYNTAKNYIGVDNLILVSPDAGAYKKVYDYGLQLELPVVAAVKHRDLAGNVDLKFMGDVKGKRCLIVDDLCDGGYTFYLLAKALRAEGATEVYLYVSHGYFSKGFTNLLEPKDPESSLIKSLDGIFCTNSVKDITNDYFDGYNMKNLRNFVTQFNYV